MLWLKAFHVIFVVTWFAGLFYLPRLFVYHSMTENRTLLDQFAIMQRRLFIMMTIGGVMSLIFGLALVFRTSTTPAYLFSQGWWHAKLALIVLLVAYHIYCHVLMTRLISGQNRHSHRWYRWFNEIPSLFLIAIVILVVVRPI